MTSPIRAVERTYPPRQRRIKKPYFKLKKKPKPWECEFDACRWCQLDYCKEELKELKL